MVVAVVLGADGVGTRTDVVGSVAAGVHIDAAGFVDNVGTWCAGRLVK